MRTVKIFSRLVISSICDEMDIFKYIHYITNHHQSYLKKKKKTNNDRHQSLVLSRSNFRATQLIITFTTRAVANSHTVAVAMRPPFHPSRICCTSARYNTLSRLCYHHRQKNNNSPCIWGCW